jgi:hypothetical protein
MAIPCGCFPSGALCGPHVRSSAQLVSSRPGVGTTQRQAGRGSPSPLGGPSTARSVVRSTGYPHVPVCRPRPGVLGHSERLRMATRYRTVGLGGAVRPPFGQARPDADDGCAQPKGDPSEMRGMQNDQHSCQKQARCDAAKAGGGAPRRARPIASVCHVPASSEIVVTAPILAGGHSRRWADRWCHRPGDRGRSKSFALRPGTRDAWPMDDDWRLQGQEPYLTGVELRWSTWAESCDHDHCEFCSAEISDRPVDDHTQFNQGWTTNDRYRWVCPPCFDDFRERFRWTVVGVDRSGTEPVS